MLGKESKESNQDFVRYGTPERLEVELLIKTQVSSLAIRSNLNGVIVQQDNIG